MADQLVINGVCIEHDFSDELVVNGVCVAGTYEEAVEVSAVAIINRQFNATAALQSAQVQL